MEVAVKPKESSGPRQCAYCHGDDLEVEPCPAKCGSFRCSECKAAEKKCPTMGCIYGVPVEQIKEPPPEIVELAKRMGVAPSELWPPKKEAPRPTNPMDGFFDGLDRPSPRRPGAQNSAFLDLMGTVQGLLDAHVERPLQEAMQTVERELTTFCHCTHAKHLHKNGDPMACGMCGCAGFQRFVRADSTERQPTPRSESVFSREIQRAEVTQQRAIERLEDARKTVEEAGRKARKQLEEARERLLSSPAPPMPVPDRVFRFDRQAEADALREHMFRVAFSVLAIIGLLLLALIAAVIYVRR